MEEIYRSQFRMPQALYENLKAAADKNRRSVNAELVARLEESFIREAQSAALARRLEDAKGSRPAGQSEAAAVVLQGIDELKAKMAEFQRMVEGLPMSDGQVLFVEEPDLELNPVSLRVDAVLSLISQIRQIVATATLPMCPTPSIARFKEIDSLLRKTQTVGSLNSYAKEKLAEVRVHAGAALGVDDSGGHSVSQHVAWTYGALDSLETSVG